MTSIGEGAFRSHKGLIDVTIPNNVTSIGETAFSHCPELKKVTIDSGVKIIGTMAFFYCHKLTDIVVSEKNANYKSMDGVLYTKDGKTLVCYPAGKKETNYTIPLGVTNIEASAFSACTHLANIKIPNSVTYIGKDAFRHLTFTAKKYIINDIIDWFGTEVRFWNETEDEVNVSVRVNYHAMKYWAMQYGYHVTVTSPPSLVEEIRNEITAAAEKYKN